MSTKTTKNELVKRFLCFAKLSLPVFLAIALAIPGVVLGQEKSGSLSGTVKDPSGAVLPGTTVTVTNLATKRVFTTQSGGNGTFYALELEPGRYSVRFEVRGFSKSEVNDVSVVVGKSLKLDATLQVGAMEQTVEVTEGSALIDTTSTMVAHNVTSEEFDRMPKARSFQSLAMASPSVNSGEVEGGIQVNGASGAENNFMVDGLSNTSLINGKSRQNAVFEFIQEVQVKTAGVEAEYGGAIGGVIQGVTKSGGNEFHGEGHFYSYGNQFNASPTQRLLLDPADDKSVRYLQDGKFPDKSYEVGGSLGGYIIKDKLYFFTSASPQRRRREFDFLFRNGTEPDTIKQKQLYMNVFNKISWDPVRRIRTNFAWLYTPFYSTGRPPAYDGSVANAQTGSKASQQTRKNQGFYTPQSSFTGSMDVTLTNTTLLNVRGGYFYDNFHIRGVPGFSSVEYRTSSIGVDGVPASLQGPIGTQNTPRTQVVQQDLVTRAFGSVDISKFLNFGGSHNIKAGVGTQKTVNNVNDSYPGGGFVEVFWNRSFTSLSTGVTDRGTYGYYAVNDRGVQGSTGANITHLYIQDSWRIHPRLTLSLGLRTEKERIPSFRRDVKPYAFDFTFGDKMAPRIGAAFDVYGNGKLVIKGAWGRFFDWTKYELARGSFGGDTWRIFYRSLDTLDVFSLSGTNLPGRNLWNSASGSFRDRRVPGFSDIDPDIKPMSQDSLNFGVEYEVSPGMVFTGRYVHNNLLRTIEDIGSLVNGDEVYIYGNPGEGLGKQFFTTGLTPVGGNPKPKRVYDAMELSLSRRFSNGWFGNAGYVYSRLYGNYAGLANSDEISSPASNRSSTTAQQSGGSIARPGSNVTRGWDLDELLFDSRGNKGVDGRLATDRPHVFKFYGGYNFRFGTELGGFLYAGSGTPISTVVETQNTIPVLVNGRGDFGRTPFLNSTDIVLRHVLKGNKFGMSESKSLVFEFNMINIFNQKTGRHVYDYLNRERRSSSEIDLSHSDLSKGYDYRALLAATPDGAQGSLNPAFGRADIFSNGFSGRFLVKFMF